MHTTTRRPCQLPKPGIDGNRTQFLGKHGTRPNIRKATSTVGDKSPKERDPTGIHAVLPPFWPRFTAHSDPKVVSNANICTTPTPRHSAAMATSALFPLGIGQQFCCIAAPTPIPRTTTHQRRYVSTLRFALTTLSQCLPLLSRWPCWVLAWPVGRAVCTAIQEKARHHTTSAPETRKGREPKKVWDPKWGEFERPRTRKGGKRLI